MNLQLDILLVVLVVALSHSIRDCCAATPLNQQQEHQVEPSGRQQAVPSSQSSPPQSRQSYNVTFINQRQSGDCDLYWVGNGETAGGPRIYYGPLSPNGGSRIIEGFPGQVFSLVEAGTYERIAQYTIVASVNSNGDQRYILTDEEAKKANAVPPAILSTEKQKISSRCRSATTCELCMAAPDDCGWSPVRQGCFLSHPFATYSNPQECHYAANLPSPDAKSVDAWLNQANEMILKTEPNIGPDAVRKAFLILQHASKADKANKFQRKKLRASLSELTAKLDAVFDDQDAVELLDKSRHEELAKIHPNMPMVDRRTTKEAKDYIAQGIPVVITDAFSSQSDANGVHKWTLEYLYRKVFSVDTDTAEPPRFNVATDLDGQCCRYFEPEQKAKQLGYPYPFAPTTHLYRDKFEGFVKTVRKAAGNDNRNKMQHYLHEIVMNSKGEAVVAGGPAPEQLKKDLESITSTIYPIAKDQPFFGGFANAKLWVGQQGIVMPLHYDATDNMYVMAWGRKRAIIGPPGQLDTLYRYPNDHPLAGSSMVNLTSPDLDRYPRFNQAQLQEVIVGPGDILYLPAWWWHQFEQPFEDTAALNMWSRDRDHAPDTSIRDKRIREHSLRDQMERYLTHQYGIQTGVVLDSLAHGSDGPRAMKVLHAAVEQWQQSVRHMPGGHTKSEQPAVELVAEFLDTHKEVLQETRWPEWIPGVSWDISKAAVLPRDLRDRCTKADDSSPFFTHCA